MFHVIGHLNDKLHIAAKQVAITNNIAVAKRKNLQIYEFNTHMQSKKRHTSGQVRNLMARLETGGYSS